MAMTDNEFDFYFEQFSELNRIDMAKLLYKCKANYVV